MKNKQIMIILALTATFLPEMAMAHVGTGSGGFLAGLMHPFSGLDHLLTALAFGLWIVIKSRYSLKLGLGLFLLPLTMGMLLGANGLQGAFLEALLAGSMAVALLMLSPRMVVSQHPGMLLFSVFALLHGLAHGNELVALSAEGTVTAIAIALSTGMICCSGYFLANRILPRAKPQG